MTDASARDYSALRFLIADDKAFIRTVVQGMLARLKAGGVIQAANGQQAIRLLRKYAGRVHCIVSDWNMRPVGGLELLRAVRCGEIPGLEPATCFIMLTGHGSEGVVNSAAALDANACLGKPVSFEKLVKTIDRAMAHAIAPKSPSHYRALGGLEVPALMSAAEAYVPPWALRIGTSPRRAQLEERIVQIRRDAAALRHAEGDAAVPEFKNTRRLGVDEIAPGAVLAEDIYADDRAVLVGAGTRLSAGLLARLKELAEGGGEALRLWVGDQVKDQ